MSVRDWSRWADHHLEYEAAMLKREIERDWAKYVENLRKKLAAVNAEIEKRKGKQDERDFCT